VWLLGPAGHSEGLAPDLNVAPELPRPVGWVVVVDPRLKTFSLRKVEGAPGELLADVEPWVVAFGLSNLIQTGTVGRWLLCSPRREL
jgi:hypothetical protein